MKEKERDETRQTLETIPERSEAEGLEAEASGVVSTVSADASCAQLAETAVNAEAEAMDEALESSMDTSEQLAKDG